MRSISGYFLGGKDFFQGSIVDFTRGWWDGLFPGSVNSGEISFYQLESKRKIFFY